MTTDTVNDMNDPQSDDEQKKTDVSPQWLAVPDDDTTDTGWDANDADLLPAGAGGKSDEWEDESGGSIDIANLRINLSSQEADAESFPDLVAGKYRVAIFAVKVEASKSAKNPGKPMYNITFKVVDGQFKGAQMYDRQCLWAGAAYSYVMMIKALGYHVTEGDTPVVQPKDLQGKELIVRYGMGKANTVTNPDGSTTKYEARLQVRGYYAAGGVGATASTQASHADPLAP